MSLNISALHFVVKQASHQHRDHTDDDHAQSEADHQGYKKRQFGFHFAGSALDSISVLACEPALLPK